MLLLAEHDAGLLRCARLMARLLDRNKGGRGAESGGSCLAERVRPQQRSERADERDLRRVWRWAVQKKMRAQVHASYVVKYLFRTFWSARRPPKPAPSPVVRNCAPINNCECKINGRPRCCA